MKKFALIFCSFLIVCMLPLMASAQFGRGNDRVCVYRDNNFQGREQCYGVGDEVSDIRGLQISSIRVYGRARVSVYEDRDFRGRQAEVGSDVNDFARVSMAGSRSWNDRIGSIRVTSDYGRYGNDDRYPSSAYPSNPQTLQQGVCVFERPNYEGRSECWSSAANLDDLGRSNWSDRIQSIRVFGGSRVVAYRDIHYQGERVVIDRDVADLNQVYMRAAGGWDRQISSMQIDAERYNQGRRRRFFRY